MRLALIAALGPLALALGLAACADRPAAITGHADYETFCAACHGADGTGDGTLAAELDVAPADLTRISARHGGTFPMTEVMSTIDGYGRGQHAGAGPMPEFGAVLAGNSALYDDGTGANPVPTPVRLLALAEYVRSLQQEP